MTQCFETPEIYLKGYHEMPVSKIEHLTGHSISTYHFYQSGQEEMAKVKADFSDLKYCQYMAFFLISDSCLGFPLAWYII